MTEQQEKRVQLVGRGCGWMAVLGMVTLAVGAWKHSTYPTGFGFAVSTLMDALITVNSALLWAMFRHPDALRRALRLKVFGLFRPLAGLILVATVGFLTWNYYAPRVVFDDLIALAGLIFAGGLAYLIWLFHAYPERLLRHGKPDDK